MSAAAATSKPAGTSSSSSRSCTVFGAGAGALSDDFLSFVNASPSQFHAVAATTAALDAAGFKRVSERDASWGVQRLGKYYYTRNESSVCAFVVGGAWAPGGGFAITAAHTDSPVLKIKPVSAVKKHGYLQVGVECYGGGLWHTWFDRDLSVAGRVMIGNKEGSFHTRLVRINRPILRIPSLAIHLNREVNDKGFIFNKQSHLLPVIATAVAEQLGAKKKEPAAGAAAATPSTDASKKENPYGEVCGGPAALSDLHHSVLVELLAEELGVGVESIRDFELCLYDTQPACLGGVHNEFIFSRALDNLMMSFVCTQALLASCAAPEDLADDPTIRVLALFDHEECGSASTMGAGSNNMYQLLNKLNGDASTYDSAIARSYLVSADMAHAVHPNYADVHEENHRPALHKGLVVKCNANQRYATSGVTGFLMEELARRESIPTQKFVVRNDVACGSTIGPILATSCGIRTVDVGVPQLSMHSLREMCGVGDVHAAFTLIRAFYKEYAHLDSAIHVNGES